jgi:putative membrane protein
MWTTRLAIKLVVYLIAVVLCGQLEGVHFAKPSDYLILIVVLGLLNVTLRPILIILTFPVTLLTLGLFSLIVNALVITVADWLVPGFWVDNFLWSIVFAFIFGVVVSVLEWALKPNPKRRNERY